MIQAICINKIRDKNNRIQGYHIKDNYGKVIYIDSNELKQQIRNNNIQIANLTLTSDNRLVDTGIENSTEPTKPSITEEIYNELHDSRLKVITDYKVSLKYDKNTNRMFYIGQYIPSYGLDLTQEFFGDDDKQQKLVITDSNDYIYIYDAHNNVVLKTKNKMLVINTLNINDRKLDMIENLSKSAECVLSAFSSFCGSMVFMTLTSELRATKKLSTYDDTVAGHFIECCLMELKYNKLAKRTELNSNIVGYIFRGISNFKNFKESDSSFVSASTSLEVAAACAKDNGVILAIKNVKLNNVIDAKVASIYDKDYVYYEHELLIRDFNKIKLGKKIGEYKGIQIVEASLELPQDVNRLNCIKNKYITAYGDNNTIYFCWNLLANLRAIYGLDITCNGIDIYTKDDRTINIEFSNNADEVIIDGHIYSDNNMDRRNIFSEYMNLL